MRVDLFELLDGLFRGIIFFFYNLAESALLLARHPIKSPSLLYRRHQAEDRRQMSSQTLLLSGYLGAHGLLLLALSDGLLRVSIRDMLQGSAEARALGPVFLAGVATTVVLDSILRLALRRRYAQRARREAVLARTEYALFWPAVLISVCTWMFLTTLTSGPTVPEERWFTLALLGLILFGLACFATLPAAMQFWRHRPRSSPAEEDPADAAEPPLFLQALAQVPRPLALGVTAILASAFGALVVERTTERPEWGIGISGLRCHVLNNRPFIDAMVTNRMPHPLALDISEFELFVGDLARDQSTGWQMGEGETWPVQARGGPDAPPVLIAPGATVAIRANVLAPPRRPYPPLRPGMSYESDRECLLRQGPRSWRREFYPVETVTAPLE